LDEIAKSIDRRQQYFAAKVFENDAGKDLRANKPSALPPDGSFRASDHYACSSEHRRLLASQ
jgi:hypothetical protein